MSTSPLIPTGVMDAGHQVRTMDESDAPCGCVAIGLRGAAKRGVRLSDQGKPGDRTRGHCDLELDARARPFRHRRPEFPSFRGASGWWALFHSHAFDAARHCSAPLRGSGICDMICNLLTPRAPSVQWRASPYMFMHKSPCRACFYYVALSHMAVLSTEHADLRTSVYRSCVIINEQ